MVSLTSADLKEPRWVNEFFEKLLRDEERKRILVDISGVDDPTSLMIGALLSFHLLAYENLAILKFAGLSSKTRMLFRLLGVDDVIQSHYGVNEALSAFDDIGVPPGFDEKDKS